jgi:hypothetical protein
VLQICQLFFDKNRKKWTDRTVGQLTRIVQLDDVVARV